MLMEEVEQILTNLQLFQTQVGLKRDQLQLCAISALLDFSITYLLYKYLSGWLHNIDAKRIKKSTMHYRLFFKGFAEKS